MRKTKEEIKVFYAGMREKRKQAKDLASHLDTIQEEELKKIQEVLPNMSAMGYVFCKRQMESQGLEGIPGIDTKTFNGWKQSGFIVKKGEKAKIQGLTWLSVGDDENKFVYPKVYNLFHTTQVEPIGEKEYIEKEMAMANAE